MTKTKIDIAVAIIKMGYCHTTDTTVNCSECPLYRIRNCHTNTVHHCVNYLIQRLGKRKTKELLTEELI